MQSGITASTELRSAFNSFTADSSLFALPITISDESLQALDPVSFTSANFKSSLPSLKVHLQPKTPIYLVLRQSPSSSNDLIAITFIPYNAPVRSKTLYASTRSTLVRDLGLEKFVETLFVTETEEVLDPGQWDERTSSKNAADATTLSTEERELQSVKRAEEEERHGTTGRDLMGEGGSGAKWSGSSQSNGAAGGGGGIRLKITDEAKEALEALKSSATGPANGYLVQYGIEPSSETLVLLATATDVAAGQVSTHIPADTPTYTFYRHAGADAVIFIYTCPGSSKVRERMVYAASRNGVLEIAKGEGVEVKSRIEAGEPDDISEQRLMEEAGISSTESTAAPTRQGFAKPKRPGRR